MGGVRALPLVVAAALAMLALKLIGVASGAGWALRFDESKAAPALAASYRPVASAHEVAATGEQAADKIRLAETAMTPREDDPVTTGSAPPKKEAAPATETPAALPTPPDNVLQNSDAGRTTPGERAVLERLTDRRQELDERAKEIEMRESLLQAAEKRVEARIKELEAIEARLSGGKPTEGGSTEGAGDDGAAAPSPAKLKDLVTMYENMRPKDAGKIFDDLNLRVLVEVAKQMNPRKLGDVIAQMKPEAAQRLTVELAGLPRKTVVVATPAPASALPKIQGVPQQP
jgi:flagellar motility protein MotE (MotC chaperone)